MITATNQRLDECIRQGRVREDFFYRINVFNLELPPLRERKSDVLLIAEYLRKKLNQTFKKNVTGFSESAKELLVSYDWPGNVRELENVMKAAFVVSMKDEIVPEDISFKLVRKFHTHAHQDKADVPAGENRKVIVETLKKFKGHKVKTAKALGWSRVTLWKRLKEYNIARDEFECSEESFSSYLSPPRQGTQ